MPSDSPSWTPWSPWDPLAPLAHPNAPAGGTGPGFCTLPGPVVGDHMCLNLPHPDSPAAIYTWLDPARTAEEHAAPNDPPVKDLNDNARRLAAVAYGESSVANIYEEMAAIANVLVRQQKARGYGTVSTFIETNKTYAFAAHDGNQRYARLMRATLKQINADAGMKLAVKGAVNALSDNPQDYSNGAYFWDGADIRSNYAKHAKVRRGVRMTDPKHNIYGIKDKDVPGEEFWRDKDGKPTKKSRGKWDYCYESTAAWGGTIFWKYNDAYLKATANKAHD
ncbi:hypothetical protein [Siccirubricoccus phaeus]|uniref:hypothetical protein n=1 Tax=Siccirubricoccus phaeus TaxID=2595053 RepID=UPI001A9C9050|nr:hypothetical protein [Siccirubricoccus phaeus]